MKMNCSYIKTVTKFRDRLIKSVGPPTEWYGIGTNETVQYFNNTVNGTLLHYYQIDFVANGHV